MKLGMFLLILGSLMAVSGHYVWENYNPHFFTIIERDAEQFALIALAGLTSKILGGGLVIGGIVRINIKT